VCVPRDPLHNRRQVPPVFFVHGGVGSACVWLEEIDWLYESGYPGTVYAYSRCGHRGTYPLPYYRMVWKTPLNICVDDLVVCFEHARQEVGRELVLVGRSSGLGLVQYALARALLKTRAVCLMGAVPYCDSYDLYWNWLKRDPWSPLRSMFHSQRPNSSLSTVELVQTAFFGPKFPASKVPTSCGTLRCMGA
jgi:pimeloyl-ACP methyl ester carboxylesterase